MVKLEVIGNLGADAQLQNYNGNKFVSFRVAHTENWIDQKTGEIIHNTIWVSCSMNGDGGNLLQYLRQGQKVFVRGTPTFNTYSSPKTHQIECGVNLYVREIELCGVRTDNNDQQQQNQNQNGTIVKQEKNKVPSNNGAASKTRKASR